MRQLAPAFALVALAGCQQQPLEADVAAGTVKAPLAIYQPDFGANDVFREATAAAPGHELIVTDLFLPPDAVGEAHYHPWEEYLYVMGGSAVLRLDGEDARELGPGEAVVIPRRAVHTPVAGPEGVRAIVIRVHDEGDPERVPAQPVEAE